jgi:hypothetical protein
MLKAKAYFFIQLKLNKNQEQEIKTTIFLDNPNQYKLFIFISQSLIQDSIINID